MLLKNHKHEYHDNLVFNDWHDSKERNKTNQKIVRVSDNILLIGAPNVGKSTFFNKITNGTVAVSNIDRLTVSNSVARLKLNKSINIVDLPGVYNLSHPIDEELVVAHELAHEHFSKITNIIGAQSIERDLFLTLQVAETGLLNNLVINMVDEVDKSQLLVKKLSKYLNNIEVSLCQANKGLGLQQATKEFIKNNPIDANVVKYSSNIESLITKISLILPNSKISKRYYAIMLLENNEYVHQRFANKHKEKYAKIKQIIKSIDLVKISSEILVTKKNYIKKIIKDCFKSFDKYLSKNKDKQNKFDKKILKKWIGIPTFFLLLILIYYVTFGPYMGGTIKEYFGDKFLNDIVADKWLNKLFDQMGASIFIKGLFVDGIFKGFFAVLSFAPTLIILFTLVNIIQQIGILSRVSILLDDALNKFGISGRSVITLLTGFGCNVPAIMMARSSSSKKEKIISVLISPFIVCSARIMVIYFVCNAIFSPTYGWMLMIFLIFLSGLVALIMGLFFSNTLFRKIKSFFMIEMVDWRKPDFLVIFKLVWLELKEFIKKAGLIIIIANFLIWLLLHLSINGTLADDDIQQSFLAYLSKGINYILYPCGFYEDDGWKLTASLITAFPAKEIAITNLSLLFPHGFSSYFNTPIHIAQGISYIVILMFYLPCAATIAAIKKESNWKYLFVHLGSSITISYFLGIITYWISYGILIN